MLLCDGNLLSKVKPDGSATLYLGGLYEVDLTASVVATKKTTYYPGGAMRVDIVGGSNTLYYLLKDHLGSASTLLDTSGNIVANGEQRYYPFGEKRITTADLKTAHLFTGQLEVGLGGIYSYGARFYSPKLGRFLSADTVVPSWTDPQSLNRFSYVLNNPLKYIDPTGHSYCDSPNADPTECPGGNGNIPCGVCGGGGGSDGGGGNDPLDPGLPIPTGGGSSGSNGNGGDGNGSSEGGVNTFYTWTYDSQTDSLLAWLPGSSTTYSNISLVLDSVSFSLDLILEAFSVTALFLGYTIGAAWAGEHPVVGVPGAVVGYGIAQLAIQPFLPVGNLIATGATGATIIANTKSGADRTQASLTIDSKGVHASYDMTISSSTQVSSAATYFGWTAGPVSELSLLWQTVALANDLGTAYTPWGDLHVALP